MLKGVSIRLACLAALGFGVLFVGAADAQGPGFGKKGFGGGGAIEKLEGEVKALKEQMNRIEGLLKGMMGGGEKKGPPGGGGFGKGGFGKGGFPGMPGGGGFGKFDMKKEFEGKFKGKGEGFGKWKGGEGKKDDRHGKKGGERGGKGKGPDRRGEDRGVNREVLERLERISREFEELRRILRR